MNSFDFVKVDYRRWLFPLCSNVMFIEYGEPALRNFIWGEVLNSKDSKAAFLPCPLAFALKDHIHLRHTLILDPIATYFLFEFVINNKKHFKSSVPSNRQMYGYAFKAGNPIDSFGDYHRFRRRKYKLKEKYKYYAFADISNCFNSFYHHDVIEAIESRIGLRQSQEFGQFLREINAGTSIDCFPQGLYPAKVIGNWFLYFIESSMKLKSSAIIRFLDDIYFFSNSKSCIYEDMLILQHILGRHSLTLNAEKTILGSDKTEFDERELDDIKIRLLRKREDWATDYADDEEDWYVDRSRLDEEEIEYIEGLISKKNVAEEDVELALSLVCDHSEIQMKLATLVCEHFPHLMKSLYGIVGTIIGYDSELFDLLHSKLDEDVLTEFELFWLVRIVLDYYKFTPTLVDMLMDIYKHPSATSVVRAAILESPKMKYGLQDIKVETLRQEPGTLAGIASIAGLRNMGKGMRNQLYKYAAKSGRQISLLCGIMRDI